MLLLPQLLCSIRNYCAGEVRYAFNVCLFLSNNRSSSDPYAGNEMIQESFRASPDPFRTFPGAPGGAGEALRSISPPPWFIAEPHTPKVKQDFLVS